MLIYKYSGPGGLAILEHGSIFLTRPTAFNDPFDVNPNIAKFDNVVAMAEHLQRKLKDIVVLSLAENCDSLLMWAHYGGQHSGILIGFDSDMRILARPTPTFSHFDAVSYCHHRPTAERFTHIPEHELYFRKSSEWAYEREWRLVESILAVEGDVQDPKTHWPFEIDPRSVKKVVLGHRAGGLVPALHNLLRQQRYAHVELEIAGPDLRTFRLNMHTWSRDMWNQEPPCALHEAQHP
jgi:hypothetical protein